MPVECVGLLRFGIVVMFIRNMRVGAISPTLLFWKFDAMVC